MKSILKYGQTINARNKGRADNLSVFHAGVNAMREGYRVKAFERVTTMAGVVVIRKRKGE